MASQAEVLKLLAAAGRLLLEHDESTGEIRRALTATARGLSDEPCHVHVTYGGLALSLGEEGPVLLPARSLRFNMAIQAGVHSTLDDVRRGILEPAAALTQLERMEAVAPQHPRWLMILLLGSAAASLAILLGADAGAALVAGVATGLGLAVRQELGKLHLSMLTLPFVAALLGALFGGIAIRLGWTRTPGLALIVPSLILVPGPHLINGLLDLLDDYPAMSIGRLTLSTGIVMAAALGVVVGVEITLGEFPTAQQSDSGDRINLISDMLLAGIVTCGFAAAYNSTWSQLALAAVGGMVGHGLRFLALEAGWNLETATLLGGLGVGVFSAWLARSNKVPVAVIAYAGAVTMMPGLQIYRALGGALRLARLPESQDLPMIAAEVLRNALQASLVVGALTLGLVIAMRTFQLFAGDGEAQLRL